MVVCQIGRWWSLKFQRTRRACRTSKPRMLCHLLNATRSYTLLVACWRIRIGLHQHVCPFLVSDHVCSCGLCTFLHCLLNNHPGFVFVSLIAWLRAFAAMHMHLRVFSELRGSDCHRRWLKRFSPLLTRSVLGCLICRRLLRPMGQQHGMSSTCR